MMSLGNKRLISSVIWIQTLLESDIERYNKDDFEDWMYLRFLTISSLDPKFYENYLYGGMYLSIIKDDLPAAADIFELGLLQYPEDYSLNYYAGFNYFFEMGDYARGLEKLRKIKDHPRAEKNVRFVVSKLLFETTRNYDVAIEFLKQTLAQTKSDLVKEKLKMDLYSVVAQRDLECLNNGKNDCLRLDAEGIPYIKDDSGKWISKRKYKPYKIFRPEGK